MPPLPLMALALISPLLLDTAPTPGTARFLLLLALAAAIVATRWRVFKSSACLLLLVSFSCASLEHSLAQRIDDREGVHEITGVVSDLPEWRGATLRFRLRAETGPWGGSPRSLDVRWFEAQDMPLPGERWRLHLALASVRGRVNFHGYDAERYALAEDLHGVGRVRGDSVQRVDGGASHTNTFKLDTAFQRLRWSVRQGLDEQLAGLSGAGLVRALALGDRSGLSDALRADMRGTGTGHLLAISGLHVGLVALFATGLARALLLVIPWRGRAWPAKRIAPLLGLAAAAAYAGLAGFGTSPRRALVMLAVFVIAWVLRRPVAAWRRWWLALVAVLLLDPAAPLSAGFWMSFGAVAVLFLAFLERHPSPRGLAGLVRAQTALLPGLLPLSVGWFSSLGLGTWVVNLVAIPWVSLVVLPLVLVTLITLPLGAPTAAIFSHMAARSAELLAGFLAQAHQLVLPLIWTPAAPGTGTLLLAGAGGMLCLAPGALKLRPMGIALMAPLLLPPPGLPTGAVRVEALDVGQGQATWVTSAHHNLLVDPGPGQSGSWSLVDGAVLPALAAQGRDRADLVLVSHGDLDHAGGLTDLRKRWPRVAVIGNWRQAPAGTSPCDNRRAWHWDNIDFRILHPSPWLPYLGNDSSCVLQIDAPGGRLLLPGDIGHRVEARLARGDATPHRLILAPHHGSRSSSSARFLSWSSPGATIFSVGHRNRFGLPHSEVLKRYERQGPPAWSTAGCGALRATLWPDGRLETESARQRRRGPWRFAASPGCP